MALSRRLLLSALALTLGVCAWVIAFPPDGDARSPRPDQTGNSTADRIDAGGTPALGTFRDQPGRIARTPVRETSDIPTVDTELSGTLVDGTTGMPCAGVVYRHSAGEDSTDAQGTWHVPSTQSQTSRQSQITFQLAESTTLTVALAPDDNGLTLSAPLLAELSASITGLLPGGRWQVDVHPLDESKADERGRGRIVSKMAMPIRVSNRDCILAIHSVHRILLQPNDEFRTRLPSTLRYSVTVSAHGSRTDVVNRPVRLPTHLVASADVAEDDIVVRVVEAGSNRAVNGLRGTVYVETGTGTHILELMDGECLVDMDESKAPVNIIVRTEAGEVFSRDLAVDTMIPGSECLFVLGQGIKPVTMISERAIAAVVVLDPRNAVKVIGSDRYAQLDGGLLRENAPGSYRLSLGWRSERAADVLASDGAVGTSPLEEQTNVVWSEGSRRELKLCDYWRIPSSSTRVFYTMEALLPRAADGKAVWVTFHSGTINLPDDSRGLVAFSRTSDPQIRYRIRGSYQDGENVFPLHTIELEG